MRRWRSRGVGTKVMVVAVVVAVLVGWTWGPGSSLEADGFLTSLPNNFPHLNANGFSATFSTQDFVDLTTDYSVPHGTNNRSCQTCHIPQQAWSIKPNAIQVRFALTGGTHPIFNPLDANNPDTGDFTTVQGRWNAYSMLLTSGVFRRGGAPVVPAPPAPPRQWDLIAADDPHGFACAPGDILPSGLPCPSAGRLVHWRRVMPTINFHLGSATTNWDGGNNVGNPPDQLAGLVNQARRNIDGAQEGDLPPLDSPIVAEIVDFETSLSSAQIFSFSAGFLNAGGAQGGPEALSQMTKVAARFDLFDAWIGSPIAARAKIARGQELFNNGSLANPGGPTCRGCHSSANNGTNINNAMFNIQTASAAVRTPDMPLYTFCMRNALTPTVSCAGDLTAPTVQLTDAGRGNVTGAWNDLGRFKTPTIRDLSARAPYFHNGIAATLEDVVRHYEEFVGFNFTDQERNDLVAFLKAL